MRAALAQACAVRYLFGGITTRKCERTRLGKDTKGSTDIHDGVLVMG